MSEIAKVTDNKQVTPVTPSQMLLIAVEQGADLEKMEKLMDLQERWEAKEAKKSFSEAMARFQSKLGPIVKKREAHNCKYADIDDIAQAIRPVLDECGLSYRFEQEQNQNSISISCIVSHVDGYSVISSMSADSDKSGGKNDIQAKASTVTYLRRYTLTGSLGITTGQDDNDGGKPAYTAEDLITHINVVRDEFPSIAIIKESLINDDYSTAKEAWGELPAETQRELWRAPTKGGIFTTEERNKMKSNEWSAAD